MPITDDPPRAAKPPPPASAPALAGAVRVVSSVTLLSRLGGMVRDVMLARIFQDSPIGSAFAAGFAIPNMFRRLFGEGALSAAFLPEYARQRDGHPELADRFASFTVLALLLATTALTVLIELGLLIGLLVIPHSPDLALSFQLIMLMLPFMPLVCVAAILAGMLQVHGRFGPASSGPIILNGFIVAAGVYFVAAKQTGGPGAAYLLGGVTVASGVTQCTWYVRLLRPHVRWTRVFDGTRERVRLMLRRFVPALIGLGTLQLSTLLDTLIAMWPFWVGPTVLGFDYPLDKSSNVVLALTQRLYQFPLGVFGVAVATAVFPMLSRHAGEPGHFASTLRRGLRLSLFIGLPASVGLVLVREDLVAVMFGGRGGFSEPGQARSAAVLLGFAPAVWAYSLNQVFTRAFYAQGRMRTPMNVSLAMVGLNLALNCGLIWWLREAGLAWATAATATLQCLVLGVLARGLLGGRGAVGELARSVLVTAAATGAMAAGVMLVYGAFGARTGWGERLVSLAVACGTGLVAYGGSAWVLRSHELGWLAPITRRRANP